MPRSTLRSTFGFIIETRGTPACSEGMSIVRAPIVGLLLLFLFIGSSEAAAKPLPKFAGDQSFGAASIASGSIGPVDLSASLSPEALGIDSSGRVIVGAASGSQWKIRRVMPDGQIDMSFGAGGEVTVSEWGGITYGTAANLGSGEVRPDGRILLVGFKGSYVAGAVRKKTAYMVFKQLLPDGTPDPSFGTNDGGRFAGITRGAVGVALRPDGRFVVGAFKQMPQTGRTDDGTLLGFKADGGIDQTFAGGKAVDILGAPGKPSNVFDLKILRHGGILASGVVRNRLIVMRLRSDGSYDQSFGRGGRVVLLPGGNKRTLWAAARSVEQDRKGRILVTGDASQVDFEEKASYGLIIRLRPNGKLDRSFGSKGIVRLYATRKYGRYSTRLYDVEIDRAGGIWVAGSAGGSPRSERRAITARYLPNGKRDRSFFKRGIFRLQMGDNNLASTLVRDGRQMYLSGRFDQGDEEHFFLKRFLPTG